MFKSHLMTMACFALIVSVMLASLKFDARRDILRAAARNFLWMVGGVVACSWIMRLF